MRPPLQFFAAGIPKAQPRAKARAFGGFAQVYNPKTANEWKLSIRMAARAAWQTTAIAAQWLGPLRVDLTFYFPRPKSHYRSNGELKPTAPRWHIVKPDRDNLDKAVLDALTNLGIWQDDKQVCCGMIKKLYGTSLCGVEVTIAEAV